MLVLTPPQACDLLKEVAGLNANEIANKIGVAETTVGRWIDGTTKSMRLEHQDMYRRYLSAFFSRQSDLSYFSTAIMKYVVWVKGNQDDDLLFECLDRLTNCCNMVNPGESYGFSQDDVDCIDQQILAMLQKTEKTDSAIESISHAVVGLVGFAKNQKNSPSSDNDANQAVSPSTNCFATTPINSIKTMSVDSGLAQDSAVNSASIQFNLNLLRDALYNGTSFASWARLTEVWRPLIPFPSYAYQDSALYLKRLFSHDIYARLELDDDAASALCNNLQPTSLLGDCFNLLSNVNYLRIALASAESLIKGDDVYHKLCNTAKIVFATDASDPSAYNLFLRCTSWQNPSKALLLLALFALFHDEHYAHFALLINGN